MNSYPREPEAVTLDIDDTCDVVHGRQQLSLFNAHYDERCFLPIHVYDTERSRPVAVVLRPGKTPSGVEVRAHMRRLVQHIRARWPKTRILLRGDGHYARPEAMAWCEANGLQYGVSLGSRPWLHRLRPWLPRVVRRLHSYYAEIRLSPSFIGGYGFSPSRRGPTDHEGRRPIGRSPGSRTRNIRTCQGLGPRRARQALAMTRLSVSPSDYSTPSAPGMCNFRGSMAGLCAPLPTLRPCPRGQTRTAQGRCGSLLLHRDGLSPSIPCRSPGAVGNYFLDEVGRSPHVLPLGDRTL